MTFRKIVILLFCLIFILAACTEEVQKEEEGTMFEPLSYEEADQKADSILSLMTLEEKISYIDGDKSFFIRAIPRLGLKEVYMSDATCGIHIRDSLAGVSLSKYQPDKSTSFPCPLLLSSTWNTDLTYDYARSIGEECLAGGVGVLLGPGMNIYRISQCGRNFEYFGEDPYLAASMIKEYVPGVQSTGTVATLKHFVVNNTEFYRTRSNSIVDERTLHEIYTPAFKAGIDAGAKAVMTSYNLLNGEWCGQSEYAISELLEKDLGFKWLVMTDWWSVWDGGKVAKSGQDLIMPHAKSLGDLNKLYDEGKITEDELNGMVKGILRTYFAMDLANSVVDRSYYDTFDKHVEVALQTAREGIVLLRNDDSVLPLNKEKVTTILATGDYMNKIAYGGGAAEVEGYDQKQMLDELKLEFGDKVVYAENPTVEQIKSADIVLCNIGTDDSENWDRPFELPEGQENRVEMCVENNPNTIVIVSSGSGIKMTDWNDKAKAIIYAWYPGQIGNRALVEIISGKTNPSGKLAITIEKDFKDSPGYGYMPEGEKFYTGWEIDAKSHPVYDVKYDEGVLVGYRWYDTKKIEPLYHFGYGLSYTTYEYNDLAVSKDKFTEDDKIVVSFTVKNTGSVEGKETAELYIQDVESSVMRPVKELKGFKKVELKAGEEKTVEIYLDKSAFSFWNPETKSWFAEKGKFIIHVGASSNDLKLSKEIELL